MKIALLQEERYLPAFHGSNKSCRLLLEALALEGHECLALCPAFNRSTSQRAFLDEMARRGIQAREVERDVFSFRCRGVKVHGIPLKLSRAERTEYLSARIERFQPDVVVVSGDPRYYLMETALRAAPDRVVFVVHGHHHLPFGPLSKNPCRQQSDRLHRARAVIAVSRYSQDYLRCQAGISALRLHFPVYGDGPYPRLGNFDQGAVTLIRSSATKGVQLFIDLAKAFPQQEFMALRWSVTDETLGQFAQLANMSVVDPQEDIEAILSRTKVLLMPSLFPETFGLAAPEAMLRGIPVLASKLGGLPEAKLGVDYLLPVSPAEVAGGKVTCPPQDLAPWSEALGRLLSDAKEYERCATESRGAAAQFVASVSLRPFEELFHGIRSQSAGPHRYEAPCVAVVDPFDAGYLQAQELHRQGYRCLCVVSNPHIDEEITAKCEPAAFETIVHHGQEVSQTVKELRRFKVRAVLPGCETGVMLADSLSESAGWLSNGTQLSAARRDKHRMAQAVQSAGLAVPRQHYSDDLQSLTAWAERLGKWPVVVKPACSLASDGIGVCRSAAEIEDAFHQVTGRRNIAGLLNQGLLVQELIDADQYVVDTVSHQGRHSLTTLWRYGRPEFAAQLLRAAGGQGPWPASLRHLDWDTLRYAAISSSSKKILPGKGRLARTLFEYATRALDALGIRYGPAHFELMLTDEGPLLIEVGARVHGAPQTHVMSRICTGMSQIEQTFDAYLCPARFAKRMRSSYGLRFHGLMVRLKPWRRGVLRAFRRLDRMHRLPSFHQTFLMAQPGKATPSCVGVAWLIHPDEEVVEQDCRTIRQLEKQDLYDIEDA